jgi:hypothetical protein
MRVPIGAGDSHPLHRVYAVRLEAMKGRSELGLRGPWPGHFAPHEKERAMVQTACKRIELRGGATCGTDASVRAVVEIAAKAPGHAGRFEPITARERRAEGRVAHDQVGSTAASQLGR